MAPRAMKLHTVVLGIVLTAFALGAAREAKADDSRCMYKRLSPWTNRWYSMCQTPATHESCDALAMSPGISDVKYAVEACPSNTVVGTCLVDGVQHFFYQGTETVAAKACERIDGTWQPNVTPVD